MVREPRCHAIFSHVEGRSFPARYKIPQGEILKYFSFKMQLRTDECILFVSELFQFSSQISLRLTRKRGCQLSHVVVLHVSLIIV